ncbi:hypothetical protein L7F22_008554 [Adiantum nelumboides]|nr:hypothetical protein [Adiantum nelumboides]
MGTFSTAVRDPIFYAHHSNVDRLWDVWRLRLPSGSRQDHSDPNFLDTEFLFYDENANPVKIKINYSPKPVTYASALPSALASGVPTIAATPANGTIDLDLASPHLTAIAWRPGTDKARPSKTEEVLIVQGLELTRDTFASFVVFVNLPDAGPFTPTGSAKYVATFNIVSSVSQHKHLLTNIKFEIGDNLKRIDLHKDDRIVITLVLKSLLVVVAGEQSTTATLNQQRISFQGLDIKYE